MLALTRRAGEKIIIHDGKGRVWMNIKVVETNPDNTRISFDAPRDIKSDREEVFQSKKEAS